MLHNCTHAATAHRLIAHNSKEDTYFGRDELLGYHLECDNHRRHYSRELVQFTHTGKSKGDPVCH